MCGIGAIFTTQRSSIDDLEPSLTALMTKIAHRGDASRFNENLIRPRFGLSTNRLAILERDHARQPASDHELDIHAVLNGQIYNYREIRDELKARGHRFQGGDAEVLLRAYIEYGRDFATKLDGMFSFVIYDNRNGRFLIGRDHVGIKPLYYASRDQVWYVASEIKSLTGLGVEIQTLEPGTLFDGAAPYRYARYDENHPASRDSFEVARARVRVLLEESVRRRVDTDLPVAVMFSGGIDSAIVLYLAKQYHPDVTAITFGLPGSKDTEVAQRYCAEHDIRLVTYTFTKQDLIANIDDAVYYGEFFEKIDAIDSTIAHFGYYVASRLGFKVSLCGEGSDEIFAGYDLFKTHAAPDALSLYRLNNLHRTDLQRVDRASMRNTVEARVPFMDAALIDYVLGLDFSYKLRDGVEKYILREAFRDALPDYIIDRPKIRMPDGSGVKNTIIDHIEGLGEAASGDIVVADRLREIGLSDRPALYFAQKYLSSGYPFPTRRFKEAGKDYSESGYFHFVS
ncbi:7-cyano-7-deazaguanine synthase [Burkholderia plantarii]|uniref:asparagine synthetase B family protein n=1 Tax=Burkholderia plantarii TaxID=41899 RepID=UPI00272BCDD1|nr:asparagine synthase-related protein [Burkholderia plantarii]WLE63520.1 7-cyano-7-deazaguanine synthase [Burkholderia plantarii]